MSRAGFSGRRTGAPCLVCTHCCCKGTVATGVLHLLQPSAIHCRPTSRVVRGRGRIERVAWKRPCCAAKAGGRRWLRCKLRRQERRRRERRCRCRCRTPARRCLRLL